MMFDNFYSGKRILVTGSSGFKGAWLTQWLLNMGAEVHGLSLSLSPSNLLYNQLDMGSKIQSWQADIRDADRVGVIVKQIKPDVVFHLAAQPLVRESYRDPVKTMEINVMGTANLLDSLRGLDNICSVVVVTSDKCYLNREWDYAYRENDALGGYDPYSASKACAEIVTGSFRKSYMNTVDSPVRVATARAGNVIGGGDWAADRIIPDCIRSLLAGTSIPVRNRYARRPWQHVLEPLSGYLLLAKVLHEQASRKTLQPGKFDAFNFGPGPESNRTVAELVEAILQHWPGSWEDFSPAEAPHEAGRLDLAIGKAAALLDWQPVWDFNICIAATANWYSICRDALAKSDPSPDVERQVARDILDYQKAAMAKGIRWAGQESG